MNIKDSFLIWIDKFRSVYGLIGSQARNGRFYVLYPDGDKTHSLDYKTAKNYASIFRGKVIHKRTEKEVWRKP
jgi:hypothetical protein